MLRRRDPHAVDVERSVELPVGADDLWRALADATLLADWLGAAVDIRTADGEVQPGSSGRVVDDDGTVRDVLVTAVEPGRSITWHWWNERDGVSTVHLEVAALTDGSSRLRVVESLGADPTGSAPAARACARRWERATSRLWARVGSAAAR
jgi:uncharacterized protein YndB with AHSA1/START domain